MTDQQTRSLELARLVHEDNGWTTYGTIGAIVYGAGKGAQTVGNTMRHYRRRENAHRVLLSGGRVSPNVRGALDGPEDARSRLKREGIWDETRNRARSDRFLDASRLRQLETR